MKTAEWIWLNKKVESDEYAAFYDQFYVGKPSGSKIKISVAGDYNLFINGVFVSFGQYTDFSNYKVYDEIDLSKYLREGKNELYLIVWYSGKDFFTQINYGVGLFYEVIGGDNCSCSVSRAGMSCSIANGYVSHRNKIITTQLGFSYTYDTRPAKYVWEKAISVKGFGVNLVKRPNKKLQLKDLTKAQLIDEKKNLYDLGRESCGFLSIGFKAKSGERIKITYGEHIVDGEVRANIGNRDFSVELIGNGEYSEFIGAFRRLGCRYLQVYGETEIVYIGIRETEYPLDIKNFDLKDNRRRQIYETAVRTLQLCLHEHYEDCPWREQSMYITDSRNQILCGYYAYNNLECVSSAIRLMLLGQRESGLFEMCFPASISLTIPSFSLSFATILLEYLQYSNDISLVEEALPAMDKMLNYFLVRFDENGLFKTVTEEGIWHFYEWSEWLDGDYFNEDESKKERNDYDVVINAFLSFALKNATMVYSLLQKNDKAERYENIRKKLNKNIKDKFFVEKTGLFKTYKKDEIYSGLANALCVLAEVTSGAEARYICERLTDEKTEWIKNTLSMDIFRYDALLKTDKNKYRDFVLKDIDQIYGFMLEQGATSFWETIKGEADFDGAGSLCHGWSALPIYYYHTLIDITERK